MKVENIYRKLKGNPKARYKIKLKTLVKRGRDKQILSKKKRLNT